jgi:hypothetical protein
MISPIGKESAQEVINAIIANMEAEQDQMNQEDQLTSDMQHSLSNSTH